MRNPFGLPSILLLATLTLSAYAQRVLIVGVQEAAACQFATVPLISDLRALNYPQDWTIAVACNPAAWKAVQHKAKAYRTNTAFTSLEARLTVLNAEMYRDTLPLAGTMHCTPKLVLRHELGHILCWCNNEGKADRAGGINLKDHSQDRQLPDVGFPRPALEERRVHTK